MDTTHFNPQSQDENDFLATFVARQDVLNFFLRQLRLLDPKRPANHHLIIAPRGYGKTSLLRRVAITVRTEQDLNTGLIALSFREEQHNVISLDVFWRNCLQSLLEVREDEKAPDEEIAQLEAAWDKHTPRQPLKGEDQDGEPAKQTFNQHCARIGRRPLLLIDNLDTLLAGLPANHQWLLRNDLQTSGGPILIAAASRYPESTHNPAAAFYDFFRIQTLDRLSDDEVMRCLRIRAEHRGEPGKKVLDLIDQNPGRVAALNTLAGGNPRTLGVLYSVLESHAGSDVLAQLKAMLDTFTGWYQARTEELPIQSRAVFDALALNWDPLTAAKLGEATGLDTTAVSSQLTRLEKSGYVESVSLSARKKGRSGYQVSERFYNIWYLMRNGPRRTLQSIRFLTVFLESCFSPRERNTIARTVLQDGRVDPGYALALANSMRVNPLRDRLLELASYQSERLGRADEFEPAIASLRQADTRSRGRVKPTGGIPNDHRSNPLEELDAVIARLRSATDPESREQLARALFNKGVTLSELGKSDEAISAYDNVVLRFGDAKEVALREQVAMALFNKGNTLSQLGKSDEAISAYDNVVLRFGDAKEVALRERVAKALFNKGNKLSELGKSDEAISAYDNVVLRLGDAKEVALLQQVSRALNSLGNLFLEVVGDPARAQGAYEKGLAVDLPSDDKDVLHANYAYALALHGNNVPLALVHTAKLLANEATFSISGRDLLHGLSSLGEPVATRWQSMFAHILTAIEREDDTLWTTYIDDLQRLLWHVIVQGKGADFLMEMSARHIQTKYAPLYHAFAAAMDGEDYLLKINPETRQAAMRIYGGLANRLRLYPKRA